MLEYKSIRLYWLGHAGFRLEDRSSSLIIYLDPFQLIQGSSPPPNASVIFIAHSHPDHLSMDDLKLIVGPSTVIIAPPDCMEALSALPASGFLDILPDQTLSFAGLQVQAVPAYNPEKPYNPIGNRWVGFILQFQDGTRVYHAGDTDLIPEMSSFECDIALLPVSGKYVMTAGEAARSTEFIRPKIAVPMHYGSIIGTEEDAASFNENADCPVRIMEKES